MTKFWFKLKGKFRTYLDRVAKENKDEFGEEPLRGYNLNKRAYSKKDDGTDE